MATTKIDLHVHVEVVEPLAPLPQDPSARDLIHQRIGAAIRGLWPMLAMVSYSIDDIAEEKKDG